MKRQRSETSLLQKWLWLRLFKPLTRAMKDDNFLHEMEHLEIIVSKILSLAMVVVILVSIFNLGTFLVAKSLVVSKTDDSFAKTLFEVFGLFLNVLIAMEILENITGYLKKHVVQVELVIVTSLIAVARKIIILDFKSTQGDKIIGLGVATLALSVSYFIVRFVNTKHDDK